MTERTRTFHDFVVMLGSTPTTREGVIYKEFEQGDQRKFHVPCPHCNEFQVLEWPQIKWNIADAHTGNQMRKLREAWYECKKCEGRINDFHKRDMLKGGAWVPKGQTSCDPPPKQTSSHSCPSDGWECF